MESYVMEGCDTKQTLCYALYLYRLELKSSKKHNKRLNRTKLSLTDGLFTKGVRNVKLLSTDDLPAVQRFYTFKMKLRSKLQRIKKWGKLGIKNANPDVDYNAEQ